MYWLALYMNIILSSAVLFLFCWMSQLWSLFLCPWIFNRHCNDKDQNMQENKRPRMPTLPDLPEAVLLNILSRLPVKTLCKFKCVSKDWLTWISSDSYFKNLQRCQSLKFPGLISYDVKGLNDSKEGKYCTVCVSSTDMTSGNVSDKLEVKIARNVTGNPFCQVTSCRDLMCIFSDLEIVVCNPSNREFLVFCGHGQNSPNSVGIGYMASSGEYKVVRLYRRVIDGVERLGCKNFSIKDSCDDYIEFSIDFDDFLFEPFEFRPLDERLPVCVNGIMYWMMKYSSDEEKKLAYYLDLEELSFGTVRCPKLDVQEKILLSDEDVKFVEVHGLLCLECCLPTISSISFYALKDIVHGKWEKLYMISLSHVPRISRCRVLGFIALDQFVIAQISNDNEARPHYICSVKGKDFKKAEIQDQKKDRFRILHFDGLFSFKGILKKPSLLDRDV